MKETTTVSKRHREEEEEEKREVESSEEECSKRHKPHSYNHILSLLESEEDEPTQDPSSLITSLQQELTDPLSNSDTSTHQAQQNGHQAQAQAQAHSHSTSSQTDPHFKVDGEEEDKERVMIWRHLLEASDDELGIPTSREDIDDGLVGLDLGFGYDKGLHGGENGYPPCDGLWELEDETANYYALLQSQFFM